MASSSTTPTPFPTTPTPLPIIPYSSSSIITISCPYDDCDTYLRLCIRHYNSTGIWFNHKYHYTLNKTHILVIKCTNARSLVATSSTQVTNE